MKRRLPKVTYVEPLVDGHSYDAIDRSANDVVAAIIARGLAAGQHRAIMADYGGSRAHFTKVEEISGPDYSLRFRRPFGRVGSNGIVAQRCASISRIITPEFDLHLFGDHSGPRLRLPSGAEYIGHFDTDSDWPDIRQLAPVMVCTVNACDSKIARELVTAEVLDTAARWIREHIFKPIAACPVDPRGALVHLQSIPYPEGCGPLVTVCNAVTAQVFLDAQTRNQAVVRRAELCTIRCGIANTNSVAAVGDVIIPGYSRSQDDTFVLIIRPHWANNIFVVDHGAYREVLERVSGPLTLATIRDGLEAEQATIRPIAEYAGGFSEPVFYIRRHLQPKSPWRVGPGQQCLNEDIAHLGMRC